MAHLAAAPTDPTGSLETPRAAALPLVQNFAFQSFFDTTKLEQALQVQAMGSPIVSSTLQKATTPGHSLGLHPSSQTPVAVNIKFADASGGQTLILKPGQIVRPADKPFTGFDWGLPFGWLGGGMAQLVVNPMRDAELNWSASAEVIFHRATYKIQQNGALTLPGPNWPLRFPWPNGIQQDGSGNALPQKGSPTIAVVRPSRIVMRLQLATMAAPQTMRMLFIKTDDFDLSSTGTLPAVTTQSTYVDQVWPVLALSSSTVGGVATVEWPMLEVEDPVSRIGGDACVLCLIATDANSSLAGKFVDIVRYGYL